MPEETTFRDQRLRQATVLLAATAVLLSGACDQDPRAPTAPSSPVTAPAPGGALPVPGGPFTVTVVVTDFNGSPLAGATVDVPSPSEPLASGTTDGTGECRLEVPAGTTTLRVQKDEYVPAFVNVRGAGEGSELRVTLYSRGAPGQLAGTYELTVTVSSSCTAFPHAGKQMSYLAHVEAAGETVSVELGPYERVVAWDGRPGFTGTREGDSLQFVIRDTFDEGYNFVGRMPGIGDVYHQGVAFGAHKDGKIVAIFNGRIALSPSSQASPESDTCEASDHRLEFVLCDDPVNCGPA